MHDNSALLLTGAPGIGKSTVIAKVIEALGDQTGGFYTREVREQGRRTGFELVTLGGQRARLATTHRRHGFARPVPFGRYMVSLDGIERLAVPAMRLAAHEGLIVVVDEIGPMELLSDRFTEVVLELLAGEVPLLGTIVARHHPVADRIKALDGITLLQLTLENRDRMPSELVDALRGST